MINCPLKTFPWLGVWVFCQRGAWEAKHPNIATYFDILEGPNHFFIIMEAASLYAHKRDKHCAAMSAKGWSYCSTLACANTETCRVLEYAGMGIGSWRNSWMNKLTWGGVPSTPFCVQVFVFVKDPPARSCMVPSWWRKSRTGASTLECNRTCFYGCLCLLVFFWFADFPGHPSASEGAYEIRAELFA